MDAIHSRWKNFQTRSSWEEKCWEHCRKSTQFGAVQVLYFNPFCLSICHVCGRAGALTSKPVAKLVFMSLFQAKCHMSITCCDYGTCGTMGTKIQLAFFSNFHEDLNIQLTRLGREGLLFRPNLKVETATVGYQEKGIAA